jgi:ribonuclease HII
MNLMTLLPNNVLIWGVRVPDFSIENTSKPYIIGFDEAGRGPLAGPVVAACVYVSPETQALPFWMQVNDSKKLSKTLRHTLFDEIQAQCFYGIGQASPAEIDDINILQASFLAMERAYEDMIHDNTPPPNLPPMGGRMTKAYVNDSELSRSWEGGMTPHALIDGNRTPKTFPIPTQSLTKGDSKSLSIAAASILAKVTRDRIMEERAREYPHYGWDRNAAYPTKAHLSALETHGITPHHRQSYAPVKKALKTKTAR